jgi:hypothetical protein
LVLAAVHQNEYSCSSGVLYISPSEVHQRPVGSTGNIVIEDGGCWDSLKRTGSLYIENRVKKPVGRCGGGCTPPTLGTFLSKQDWLLCKGELNISGWYKLLHGFVTRLLSSKMYPFVMCQLLLYVLQFLL